MATAQLGRSQLGRKQLGAGPDETGSLPGSTNLEVTVGQPTVAVTQSAPGSTSLEVTVGQPSVANIPSPGSTNLEVTVGQPSVAGQAAPGSTNLEVTVGSPTLTGLTQELPTNLFVTVGQPLVRNTALAYTLYVGDIEATQYFDATRSPFSVNRELNGRSSCSFGWISDGTVAPQVGQEVRFMLGASTVFAGTIQEYTETTLGESDRHIYSVSATDFNAILDHRIVFRTYTGYSAYEIVQNLVGQYLSSEGIYYVDEGDPGVSFTEDIVFNGITLNDALSRMRDATGWETFVDDDKGLHFFDPTSGWEPAPTSLAQGDGKIVVDSARVRKYRGTYTNVQWVRSSLGTGGSFTETTTSAPGQEFKIASYVPPNWHTQGEPFPPKINIVGATGSIPSAIPWHWLEGFDPSLYQDYTFDGFTWTAGTNPSDPDQKWQARIVKKSDGQYLVLNEYDPEVAAAGTVQSVTVETPLEEGSNNLTKVSNSSQITARAAIEGGSGLWEHVEDIGDVENQEEATALANALLDRKDELPLEFNFQTDTPGWRPGQTLTANLTRPLVPNGSYLVQSVKASEFNNSLSADSPFLRWEVQAVSGSAQITPIERLRRERARERPNRSTSVDNMDFLLAKTVNGATNPGLETGSNVVNNTQVVMQKGQLVTLVAAADTAPTGADIQIDVLRQVGGVGAFSSVLPSGSVTNPNTAETITPLEIKAGRKLGTMFLSAANVVRLDKNDQIRIDVLQIGSSEPGKDVLVRLRILV